MGRPRKLSDEKIRELVELRGQGMSFPKLAKRFNIPCSTVQCVYKRAVEEKIQPEERAVEKKPPDDIQEIKDAIYEVKIMEQLKEVSDLTVNRILDLLKDKNKKFGIRELGSMLSVVMDKIRKSTPYAVKPHEEGLKLDGFSTQELIVRAIEVGIYDPSIPGFMNSFKKTRTKKIDKTPVEPEDADFKEIPKKGGENENTKKY